MGRRRGSRSRSQGGGIGSQPRGRSGGPAHSLDPHDGGDAIPEFMWRIMRVDMDDLVFKHHPAMELDYMSDEMHVAVLKAVATGSKRSRSKRVLERSPFLHGCST